jgi:integrase
MRTSFAKENDGAAENSKEIANKSALESAAAEAGGKRVKFPKAINHRGRTVATIYGKCKGYPHYRLYYREGGRSVFRHFPTYSEALAEAEKKKADLYAGKVVTLTGPQARDAKDALERLQTHYEQTGHRLSLLEAVSELCSAASKLNGGEHTVGGAVAGFMKAVVTIQRKDIAAAVEQFLAAEEPRTKADHGKRPEISPKYHYGRAIILRRFAATFPSTALCDLTKAHVDKFFKELGNRPSKSRNRRRVASAKGRNDHRAAIRQLLQWAGRNDYLATNHRLLEADSMRPEKGNTSEIQFYLPGEFAALLEAAEGQMRPMIAIGGLAGLRTSELLSLTWEDTRRCEGHIEIRAGRAKTRQRRLVEIVPALAAWLQQFKGLTGKICTLHEITFQQHFNDLCEKAKVEVKGEEVAVARKPNGLRHSYCTFHLAAHGNENATALQAGNSPQMLFSNYRGLARKREAEEWFAVAPNQPDNVINYQPEAAKGARNS